MCELNEHETIETFQKKIAQFPEQYTPEWFAKSRITIGGSEMHDLIHNPDELLKRKVATISAPPPDDSNFFARLREWVHAGANDETLIAPSNISMTFEVATGWGTLFEPVACDYIARRLGLTIQCRNASWFSPPFRFSPDGVLIDKKGTPAILEMKNPYQRIPAHFADNRDDGFIEPHELAPDENAVPERYREQLQMGLFAFPFIQYCYYVETVYRRATAHGSSFALGLQKMRDGALELRQMPAYDSGFIGFYNSHGTGNLATAHNFMLYGSVADLCLFYCISNQRSAGIHHVIPLSRANIEDLPANHAGLPLFGYLHWNLLGARVAKVVRRVDFMTPHLIDSARDIIKRVSISTSGETKPDTNETKQDDAKVIATKPDDAKAIATKPDGAKAIATKPDGAKAIATNPNEENIIAKTSPKVRKTRSPRKKPQDKPEIARKETEDKPNIAQSEDKPNIAQDKPNTVQETKDKLDNARKDTKDKPNITQSKDKPEIAHKTRNSRKKTKDKLNIAQDAQDKPNIAQSPRKKSPERATDESITIKRSITSDITAAIKKEIAQESIKCSADK